MRTSELLDTIKTSVDRHLFAIVGPNTVGKSYSLNFLHSQSNGESLLIDEEGDYRCNIARSKIKRVDNKYLYVDESNKGKEGAEGEYIEIESSSKQIISVAENCKRQLNVKFLSSGSKKLNNILDIILSLNLNNIKIFYFDEPENFLDDQSIKVIQSLFDALIKNGKTVVFVTHSPRLLEVLRIDIDSIYLLPKIYGDFINLTFEQIKNLYRATGAEIKRIRVEQTIGDYDNFKILMPGQLEYLFLQRLLSSQEFYRSLFYNEVFLLEGLTERCVLEESPKLLQYTQNVFYCNGKYQAPFLIKLFVALHKHVVGVFDGDDGKEGELSYEINSYLTQMITTSKGLLSLKFIPKNLESFLGIQDEDYHDILGTEHSATKQKLLARHYKPYVSLFKIRKDTELISKLETIFNTNSYSAWTTN